MCYSQGAVEFDTTRQERGSWRITANPLAWGSNDPEIVVLGFSKGPTQVGALATRPHDEIAFAGGRTQLGKILAYLGLAPMGTNAQLKAYVDALVADPHGRFHFGSLVRCSVERYDTKRQSWTGTGGSMLDGFLSDPFGHLVTGNCGRQFLAQLPERTKLVVMLGLGSNLNYVQAARRLFERVRPGPWSRINSVAYTDGAVTVVHVEHFKSQGALLPQWLGEREHSRSQLGLLAKEAVASSEVQPY
jgi:hypothetical protein